MAFGGDLLREPRMQQVVARAECDGTGTDNRDHLLHLHASEELVPKHVVQFSDHDGVSIVLAMVATRQSALSPDPSSASARSVRGKSVRHAPFMHTFVEESEIDLNLEVI
jgi:hypothetical protein